MRAFRISIMSLIFVGLVACSSTQTTATWSKQGESPSSFQKVAVLAVIGQLGARQSFEMEMVQQLEKQGINAISAMEVLPPKRKRPSVDLAIEKLKQAGVDGVLVVTLSDVDRQREYIRGSSYIRPRTYYNRFGDYYVHTYRRVYQPGYFRNSTTYFLESSIYDLQDQQLIWVSESRSTDPGSLKSASRSYAKSIIKSLNKDFII